MPPVYINDSVTYSSQLGGQSPGVEPSLPTSSPTTGPMVVPPDPVLSPERDRGASTVAPTDGEPTPSTYAPTGDGDACCDPPATAPSADFLADLANSYGITDQANIMAVWKWYLREPADLTTGEKAGNAVIRQIMAVGKPLVPSSTARPDLLKPEATRATVRSANGVTGRVTPWGKTAGSAGSGASVTIRPPASGVWYDVEGVGWVCGLWLDLR